MVAAEAAISWINLINYLSQCDVDLEFFIKQGSNIINNREQLVKDSLATGCSHILFIDDDMVFTPYAVAPLIQRKVPIVLSNYLMKTQDIRKWTATCVTTKESTGTEEVEFGGFGLSLIETEVFKTIPQPWFFTSFNPETSEHSTEDFGFFQKAKEYGFKCLVDHDASKLVKHQGMYQYAL